MPGTDGGTRGFDPRFDPQFQPGYRPDGGAAAGPPPARPAPGVEIRAGQDPRRGPAGPEPVDADPRAHSTGQWGRRAEDLFDDGVLDDEGETAAVASWRSNPYVLAVWAVGAGLVVAGLVLLGSARSLNERLMTAGSSDQFDYFVLQSMTSIAPQLIVLGLATAVAQLFFHALRHERGRERPDSERPQV
jgi:hypothetical protein